MPSFGLGNKKLAGDARSHRHKAEQLCPLHPVLIFLFWFCYGFVCTLFVIPLPTAHRPQDFIRMPPMSSILRNKIWVLHVRFTFPNMVAFLQCLCYCLFVFLCFVLFLRWSFLLWSRLAPNPCSPCLSLPSARFQLFSEAYILQVCWPSLSEFLVLTDTEPWFHTPRPGAASHLHSRSVPVLNALSQCHSNRELTARLWVPPSWTLFSAVGRLPPSPPLCFTV